MYTCTRRIQFCAGHRVHLHESKCRNLHGHNYVAYLTAEAPELDDIGRVVDFSVLKDVVGGWIDRHWDHGFVLMKTDAAAIAAVQTIENQKLYLMPWNPTAENMARYLRFKADELFRKNAIPITTKKVVLWETENCYAEDHAPIKLNVGVHEQP